MNRTGYGIACAAALIGAAGAYGQQEPTNINQAQRPKAIQASPARKAPQARPASTDRAGENSSATALLRRLAGEWEGQVQVRGADGMTSASVVSASNRLEDGERRLASCLTGFAFAKPFEGAAVLRITGPEVSSSWSDTINKGTSLARAEADRCARSGATLAGRGATSEQATIEQSFTMTGDDNYVFELNSVGESGRRTLLVRLDMTRLPSGRRAEASAKFKDAPLLARLRTESPTSTQASVSTDE